MSGPLESGWKRLAKDNAEMRRELSAELNATMGELELARAELEELRRELFHAQADRDAWREVARELADRLAASEGAE